MVGACSIGAGLGVSGVISQCAGAMAPVTLALDALQYRFQYWHVGANSFRSAGDHDSAATSVSGGMVADGL